MGWLSLSANAYVDRNIIVKGVLKDFDSKTAVVQTETGTVNVPPSAVRALNYHSGQSVMLMIDIADFLDLNRTAIAKLGANSAKAPSTSGPSKNATQEK